MDIQQTSSELSLSQAQIGTVRGGEAGFLVWKSGQLVAVLTEINEETYSVKGKWFLEAGFGLLSGKHRNFDTVDEALNWVGKHVYIENYAVAPISCETC